MARGDRVPVDEQRRKHLQREKERRLRDVEGYRARKRELYWVHREANLERAKRGKLLQRYGKTTDWVRDQLVGQAARCAICPQILTKGRGMHIDHDHRTGMVRGLLCPSCNMLIAFLDRQPEWMEAAIRYLDGAGAGVTYLELKAHIKRLQYVDRPLGTEPRAYIRKHLLKAVA